MLRIKQTCQTAFILPVFLLLLLSIFLLTTDTALAQTRIHRNLTPADGLVQSQVISMHEDQNGYLWIGTFGGLSRWDGRTFTNFTQADGMGHKEVQSIAEGLDGTLYFSTKGGGVSIWKDDHFTVLNTDDGLPDNVSRAIAIMPNGDVAVGTDAGVCLIRDGKVIPPKKDNGLTDLLVVSLAVTSDGTLHVATWGDGLLKASGNPLKVIEKVPGLPVQKVRAMAVSSDDQVYFAPAGAGLYKLINKEAVPVGEDPTFGGMEIVSLYVRSNGTIFVGSQKRGVLMLNQENTDQLTQKNGLVSNTVWAICEGRDNLLFLGTWGGVSIFDQDRILSINTTNGLAENIVTCIDFSSDGKKTVFGFPDQGVQIYHQGELSPLKGTDNETLHMVWDVHQLEDNHWLIGSDFGVHRHQFGKLEAISTVDGTQLRSVQAITKGLNGGLTVLDMHNLFQFDGNQLKPFLSPQNSDINKANDVLEISPDSFLLATINGIFLLSKMNDQYSVIPYEPLASLKAATIWDLHQLKDGRILLGTNEKGLAIFSPNNQSTSSNLQFIDTSTGLSDNTVLAIAEDNDGDVFLSTNRGINFLHPLPEGWRIKHIGHQDGLGSDECVQGALAVSPDGFIWVGTIGGASRYNKQLDASNSLPPLLIMDKFSIFDREIPPIEFAARPEFSHQDNYLKIEFTGIHLPKPDEVFYRYKLSSVDQNWVQSQRQYVQYTNLAPGHYRFEISARLPDGSNSPDQIWEFSIKPPFWQTWWFIVTSILIVGGSIALVVSFRIRQLLALERLRTRIAADLHDDIGSGLTEISIISSLIPHKLPNEASDKIEGDLDRIGETSRQLITSMSDIVWLVNPSLDSLFDLLAKLGESNSELLSASGIRFEDVNLDSLQKIKLPMEHRRQLLLIFKEAINNAVKYSEADHIRLEAQYHHHKLSIILTDNGKGFDPVNYSPKGGGNGLKNMRTRAEKISGVLSIESSPTSGTQIVFKGPTR